ncbi:hypothetical protein [Mesorhizobium sp.]|uniref:hypothetical protein n=1 Tax=Mesorhizobium sp. TaxID=1871066 RepID=UPI000FE6EAA3|nr:hypothetical protein [Mesorhizobium sp.]RWO55338.1 MAG: hypothetical protein EOS14_30360 [Mesorhizobium sp.]
MRDHAAKWPVAPNWETARLETQALSIHVVIDLDQQLVGGNLGAWSAAAESDGIGAGAFAITAGDPYCVRLARDQLLWVGHSLAATAGGWCEEGYTATDVGAGLQVFEVSGPAAPSLMQRATALDLAVSSPSAAMLFAGVTAIVYRYRYTDTFRVHVDRALATHVWTWFQAITPLLSSPA